MRFKQRHVHATIVNYLTENLTTLGWLAELGRPEINFGATPVTIMAYEPQAAGETPPLNSVAISIDEQGEDEAAELGGLESVEYTLFVDVYGENQPIAIAITDDVKDLLKHKSFPVKDYGAGAIDTDLWLEFESVIVEAIPSAATTLDKRTWRAVKATAVCYF